MYVHICRPQCVLGKPYPPATSFISKFAIMEDFTEKMLEYSEIQSDLLASSGVCGFVFKKDSPSCGVERVKVYRGDKPQAVRDGRGMFATVFTTLNPHIPVIEEGRMSDSRQAEHFLARVHFFHEWYRAG